MAGTVHHIFGPPGCGKTTYLMRRIVATQKARGSEAVLSVSYTKAAAGEVASRMEGTSGGSGGRGGDGEKIKRVGTLHSILYHLHGFPSIAEVKAADWNKTQPANMRLSKKRGVDDLDAPKYKTRGDELMAKANLYRARMIPRELWRADVRGFYNRWCEWKDREGHLDFTDWIEQAIEQRLPPPEGCSVGIADECQDFSKLEITLLRQWSQDLDAMVFAYDDDQALFTWRGADPGALLEQMPAPPERCKVLEQSYRVPRAVHAVAQAWITQSLKRIPKEYLPRPEDGRVRRAPGYTHERPEPMLDMVSQDLAEGEGSVMILATCGYLLNQTLATLRKRGIPFHNPYRADNGAWNPLSSGATARRIVSFSRRCPRFWDEGEAMLHVWTAEDLADWTQHLGAGCFTATGKKKELLDWAKDKERKGEVVNELDYLTEDTMAWVERGDLNAYEQAIVGNKRKAYEFPLSMARRDFSLLTAEPRIIVGTVHSVKGAEAENVYLYPDLSQAGFDEWSRRDKRDNVRRVMYVGMTRARENLTILGPASNLAVNGM